MPTCSSRPRHPILALNDYLIVLLLKLRFQDISLLSDFNERRLIGPVSYIMTRNRERKTDSFM